MKNFFKHFGAPVTVLLLMGMYGAFRWAGMAHDGNAIVGPFTVNFDIFAMIAAVSAIVIGSYSMFREALENVLEGHFSLDYIAILAIVLSLVMQNFFVGTVIALMLCTGRTLEEYGSTQAKESLTKLSSRIPDEVLLFENGAIGSRVSIGDVKVGQQVFVRKGEVIPLDGVLFSENAYVDESSLTGEPYLMDKIRGDQMRSGTVNLGEGFVLDVTKAEKDSTYHKIIRMVTEAQEEKPPLVRLADRWSLIFTLVTFVIVGVTYFFTRDLSRVLAILVIATPCPLILATPIALMGGMNAAAKNRIIVKKLASLEVLSRVDVMIFDKTGTLTLGRPVLTDIHIEDGAYHRTEILGIAEAIERSSLHPFAKAIVEAAKTANAPVLHAQELREVIGHGIHGTVSGKRYELSKITGQGMGIQMMEYPHGDDDKGRLIARFSFDDVPKQESAGVVEQLLHQGMKIFIYTGDRREAAEKIAAGLPAGIQVRAQCTPEDKKNGIHDLKADGKIVAMVGDGINDAPALALANVGMVFSNEEQTAASEAADIVFLGGDFSLVLESLTLGRRTIRIAIQSIFIGIGLSVVGMLFAAFGAVPAFAGALFQELIDVIAILNALRAARL